MPLTMLNGSVNQKQPTIFPQQLMELCPSELNRQGVQVAHVNSFSLQTLGDGGDKQVSRANSYRSLDEYSDQDKFVERHNTTAEIYQIFKDNVDTLFSRKILPEKQAEFVNRILTIVGQLLISMEAEKQYLMSEVLCGWAVQQQKLSVAAQWTQQMNYSLLNTIDTQFEYFGELLEQTLTGLGYLVSEYPGIGFEQYQQQLRQMTHLFLFYSIIVSRQPPSVVVKCGEAENHRRSRFWFNTEIRILGGRAFGLDRLVDGVSIQCLLITDETAKRLRNNAYHDICEHEEFAVEPMIGHLKNFDQTIVEGSGNDQPIGPIMVAKFEDMRVAKKEQLRRESVAQKRYHLCYTIKLQTLKHQIDLVGKKVSLPFAILVGPKMDVDAKLFMERSFADFVRRPDGELPALVNGQEMALLEIPQKPTDQIALNQPRPFNLVSKQHLLGRLKPDVNGQVPVENFLRMPVAEEFCINKKAVSAKESGAQTPLANSSGGTNLLGAIDGEWKLVPFFEWFFKLAEMVNKHFLQMWNDGLIFGFCGKEEAERLLMQCQRPTLLVRFSDIEFAKVKISVSCFGKTQHHWYDQIELQGRSLSQELLNNKNYENIEFIWPQTNIEWALGARERCLSISCAAQRKPRQLQPSALYFENQGAGMGSQSSSGLRF
uniref:Signal transducer and activator of transcription b N-terminal domain-containing protein n=1 Tax=Meloidogyne enterolobii TaxID=390850 RepID=A0A6V7XKT9_MELEN|nr:unnamed protein product [Meloidogyne enterolobii]